MEAAEALAFVSKLLPGTPAIVVSVWKPVIEEAGLEAEALAIETAKSVWEAVEQVAHETHARLIACGTAKSGVKATVPTVLPNPLVQRSSKPVLVVPSSRAAAERRREIEKA